MLRHAQPITRAAVESPGDGQADQVGLRQFEIQGYSHPHATIQLESGSSVTRSVNPHPPQRDWDMRRRLCSTAGVERLYRFAAKQSLREGTAIAAATYPNDPKAGQRRPNPASTFRALARDTGMFGAHAKGIHPVIIQIHRAVRAEDGRHITCHSAMH